MAVITPTLNLTANSNTVSTNPGPYSFSLALAIADTLTIDVAEHRTIETSTTLNVNTNGVPGPIDGSDVGGGTETPGTVGCFIYLKNNSTTTGENIYIGVVAGGGRDTPTAPAASGTTALDEATNATLRTFTLLPGEFAWFPWDYTGDIHWEAATGTPQLEYWRFDRG